MMAAGLLGVVVLLGVMARLRTTTGDLVVEVNEPGATVEVFDAEGKVIVTGTSSDSPLVFSLEPGRHQTRVEKNGFIAYTGQIDIESGGKTSVTARLDPTPAEQGTLVVKGAEVGALVELLDLSGKIQATYRTNGAALSIPVAAGIHRVRLERDGTQLLLRDVRVVASQTVEMDASSAFEGQQQAVASPPTTPTDAATTVTQPSSPGSAAADTSWQLPAGVPPPAVAPFDAAQAKQHQDVWAKYLNISAETTNSIGMKLVLIPAGEFVMGSPATEDGRASDEQQHRVRITQPIYLGAHEVTQAQYQQVIGTNSSHFKDARNPVETVSWDDAVRFCHELSALPEEQAAGRTYRLPTEAEWEYACRAGGATKWNFGNTASGMGEYAWYEDNSQRHTHPVGERRPTCSACTICTEMCGSGVGIGMTPATTRTRHRPIQRGPRQGPIGCSGAVAGTPCVELPFGEPQLDPAEPPRLLPGLPRRRSSLGQVSRFSKPEAKAEAAKGGAPSSRAIHYSPGFGRQNRWIEGLGGRQFDRAFPDRVGSGSIERIFVQSHIADPAAQARFGYDQTGKASLVTVAISVPWVVRFAWPVAYRKAVVHESPEAFVRSRNAAAQEENSRVTNTRIQMGRDTFCILRGSATEQKPKSSPAHSLPAFTFPRSMVVPRFLWGGPSSR